MSLKSVSGGWRGLSMSKESAYGTPATVNTSLNFAGDFLDAKPEKVWDDRDEFTGELTATRVGVLTSKTDGKHSQNAMPHNLAIFFAWALGACATTDPGDTLQNTVRKHKINMSKDMVEPPTRTVRELVGGICKEYPGIACSEVNISAAREEFAKVEAVLIGMGKEDVITPVPSRPAQVVEEYLRYRDITLKKGGTYDGSVVTGGVDISARVENFKLSVKNGAKQGYLFGSDTPCAGRVTRARLLEIALDMKVEFEDDAEKNSLLAGDTFIVEIPMIGELIGLSTTNRYAARIVLPKVAYNKVARTHDDGTLKLDLGFAVLADPTHGPLDIHIVNEQTAYL